MIDFKENTAIKDALQNDEKVIWAGKPANFSLMDAATKTSIILRWLISAIIGIGCIVAYCVAYGGTDIFEPLVIVVVLAVMAFVILRPITDRRNIIKKVFYCITDKRVLVSVGNRDLYELNRNGLKASFTESTNGCVHVALGSCSDMGEKKFRVKALAPKRGQADVVTGFVMYNVDNTVRNFFNA